MEVIQYFISYPYISCLQEELEVIKQNIEEVIRENQRLHLRLEQTDAVGPISMTEW